MRALTTHGEAIAQDDLAQCLRALVGTDAIDDAVGGKTISAASCRHRRPRPSRTTPTATATPTAAPR